MLEGRFEHSPGDALPGSRLALASALRGHVNPMKPALLAGTGASLLSLSTLLGAATLLMLAVPARADTGVCLGAINPLGATDCQGGVCAVTFNAQCYAGGTCVVNAGASWCSGLCLVNVDAAACDAGAVCGANAHGSECQQGGTCGVNHDFSKCQQGTCVTNSGSSWCDGRCAVNLDAAACDAGATCGVDAVGSECRPNGLCGPKAAPFTFGPAASGGHAVDSLCDAGICGANALGSDCLGGRCVVNAAASACDLGELCAVQVLDICDGVGSEDVQGDVDAILHTSVTGILPPPL